MTLPSVSAGPREALHLLNRAGFGPQPGGVRAVLKQGLENYIRAQLAPTTDPVIERRLRPLKALTADVTEVLAVYHRDARKIPGILNQFYTAKMIRAVHSKNQLEEVLVDFWFNHFNVDLPNMFVRQAVTSYERDAIRPHVFGKFRTILGATAAHPAMLFYLDNYLNKKNAVANGKTVRGLNENYGRELLELHTVGVHAGYTQAHVVDAARCFTGWTLDDLKTGRFVYRPDYHDTGAKEVFGLKLPAGGGRDDAEKLLDYLAVHPATGHFVSWKLAQRFVADVPPATLVDRCAKSFVKSGGDIRSVVETLLLSPEFWGQVGNPKLKTPFEFVVSTLRATDTHVSSAVPALMKSLASMGQQPYFSTAPTGYSNRGMDWVNPLYLHRLNFALDLAAGRLPGVVSALPDVIRNAGGDPNSAPSIVATLNREIFADTLSPDTLKAAGAVGGDGIPAVSKAVGLVLASPEMQAR